MPFNFSAHPGDNTKTDFYDDPFDPSVYPSNQGLYGMVAKIRGQDQFGIAGGFDTEITLNVQ
jgi:hypothetical protein